MLHVEKCLGENMKIQIVNNKISFQKDLVISNPKLVYKDGNGISKTFEEDCQFLYMFPLTIVDYLKAYEDRCLCKLVIVNFKIKDICNISKHLSCYGTNTKYNRCMEFEVEEDLCSNEEFEDFLKELKERGIFSVVNVKNGSKLRLTKKTISLIDCFKFSIECCEEFENIYGEFFSTNFEELRRTNVKFKIYLNLEEVDKYYNFVDKYKDLCDFVLFTKRLIGANEKNINLPQEISFKLHFIKWKFSSDKLHIKIVKNLFTLYYDMFVKDERNSKVCYACKVCNYLIGNKFYPCATKQIIRDNITMDVSNLDEYTRNSCKDCASLFENDFLDKILKDNPNEFCYKRKNGLETIFPVGIGTFKLDNYENLEYGMVFGQNLIDCNLAYKKGETLRCVSKNLKMQDRSRLFLYCKLYKQCDTIQDIKNQVDEYLNLFNTQYLDIISIHSLEVLGKLNLLEVYGYLESLKKSGIIRHIGVCNVSLCQLDLLIKEGIKIETFEGPFNYYCKYYEDVGLLDYCKEHNIRFFAYQPFMMGDLLKDDLLKELTKKYKKSTAQVLLNYYILHKKVIPIVKSSNENHLYENVSYDFYISKDDYYLMDKQNVNKKYNVEFTKNAKNKIYQLSYNLKNKKEKI